MKASRGTSSITPAVTSRPPSTQQPRTTCSTSRSPQPKGFIVGPPAPYAVPPPSGSRADGLGLRQALGPLAPSGLSSPPAPIATSSWADQPYPSAIGGRRSRCRNFCPPPLPPPPFF